MSTALRTYYRGHSLVAMRDEVAQQTRYYHLDNQGTVQALTDSTGAVTDRFASDAWGVQVKRTGSSINRQWYIGNLGYYRQVDQLLDYVRARYYAMPRARWAGRDPLPVDGRSYGYAAAAPSARADPSGLITCAAPCVPVSLLRTSCPKPCNHNEKGTVEYPPPYPSASDVASLLARTYKICDGDYTRNRNPPWKLGQALTRCCREEWCRTKCEPEEEKEINPPPAGQPRVCYRWRGCIEIIRAPGQITGWNWLPKVYQFCLWEHESRRAKICQCSKWALDNGGEPSIAETDRLLDCVGRVLDRYNKPRKHCTPPPPGQVVPFDPKPPDCKW